MSRGITGFRCGMTGGVGWGGGMEGGAVSKEQGTEAGGDRYFLLPGYGSSGWGSRTPISTLLSQGERRINGIQGEHPPTAGGKGMEPELATQHLVLLSLGKDLPSA